MSRSPDVVVVGAGIVGAACADAFSIEGLSVAVVEADVIGGGATAAGMGHLVVMDDSEEEFALTRYSRELWRSLAAEAPAEAEFTASGTIWVAADSGEFAVVESKHAYYAARRVDTEILDAKALAEAEPNLRDGLAGGLLVPGDGVVYAPTVARWFVDRAVARGADLHLGQRATAVSSDSVTLADGSSISAGLVVNAAGTWATGLTAGIDVRPRKGHLVITDRYPGSVRHQLIELGYLKSAHSASAESVAFNVQPRPTGQLLIGSSRQFGEEGSAIDHKILTAMLQRAVEYMPGLARLSAVRAWTGFRAATPDKHPLIGPLDGVYLATGHEGLGITTSLGTARLLVDRYVGRETAIPIEPYLPARIGHG